ncbi:MAG: EamA family transporter RarD [Thermoguttaceae bacterium]
MSSTPSKRGIIYGIAAYGSWGLIPLYFKAVASVAPVEVLAHRALWSFAMLAVLVAFLGRWKELGRELRNAKLLAMLGLSTLFVATNWLMFIYAVISGQVLQASLGYFINPLVNVLLGMVFLGERLRSYQTLSILLAVVGVLVLAGFVGEVPWIALTLAITFALYGLMRKIMPVDGLVSLTVETLAMTPFALAYLGYLAMTRHEAGNSPGTLGLLALSGPVTTVPLLFFGAAARQLRLATMGILQYVSPTLQFLLAVVAFGEPFSTAQIVSFGCIWTAIAIYTADSYRAVRQARLALVEPFGADP